MTDGGHVGEGRLRAEEGDIDALLKRPAGREDGAKNIFDRF
jgi:hypothetical protein